MRPAALSAHTPLSRYIEVWIKLKTIINAEYLKACITIKCS